MKLRYTKAASRDLARIVAYIKKESPRGAMRVGARIEKRINDLVSMPRQGTADGTLLQLFVTRTKYVVIYRVRDEIVEIVRILHGAQNRRS